MTTRTIEVWGTKSFKKFVEVTQQEYDNIIKEGDHSVIREIIHDSNDWSDDAVKLRHITVDIYDEDDNMIADEIELL
jgi:hypothetical protein